MLTMLRPVVAHSRPELPSKLFTQRLVQTAQASHKRKVWGPRPQPNGVVERNAVGVS